MVSPAIYASFTLQGTATPHVRRRRTTHTPTPGWRTASLWVAAACCVTAFGGSATVHNNGGGRSDSVCTHASFKSFGINPPLARTAACPPLTSVQPPELGIFYERASMHGRPNPSAGSVNLRNSRGCRQAGTQADQSSKRPERGTLQFYPRRQKYHVASGSILVRQHRD